MKKSLLALAALGTFVGTASAQSITVYGKMDVGAVFEDGSVTSPEGENTFKITSGVSGGSRVGFRGSEDLGGGMKARFVLETGFCADGAQGDREFCSGGNTFMGRKALVALDGGFGSLQLGRQYAPSYLHQKKADPFKDGLAGQMSNMFRRMKRLNNSISYKMPTVGGFNAALAYAAGEQTGATSADRIVDASVTYKDGPLYLGIGHDLQNDINGIAKEKITNLGATYDFGVVKGYLMHQTSESDLPAPSLDEATTLIGVSAPLGQGTLMVSYIRYNDKNTANEDANQAGIGYMYPLSKRTKLYTAYAKISNKNGAKEKVGNASDKGTGDKAINLGVVHNF